MPEKPPAPPMPPPLMRQPLRWHMWCWLTHHEWRELDDRGLGSAKVCTECGERMAGLPPWPPPPLPRGLVVNYLDVRELKARIAALESERNGPAEEAARRGVML